jgi:hypothetical protein
LDPQHGDNLWPKQLHISRMIYWNYTGMPWHVRMPPCHHTNGCQTQITKIGWGQNRHLWIPEAIRLPNVHYAMHTSQAGPSDSHTEPAFYKTRSISFRCLKLCLLLPPQSFEHEANLLWQTQWPRTVWICQCQLGKQHHSSC